MMFLNNLANLIKVKTIITLLLSAVFSYLAITGQVAADQFMTIFTVVIGFYFGTQVEKNNKND